MAEGEAAGRGRRGRRARRLLPLLGIAALLAVGLPLGLERCGRAAPPAVAAPPPPAPPAAPPPTAPAAAAPEEDGEEPLPEPVRRYLEAHAYPPTSGRLTRAHASLLHPNRRYERLRPVLETLGGSPADVVSLMLTADRYYYTDDDVAHLRIEAEQGGRPALVALRDARAVREGRSGPQGAAVPVRFRREDGGLSADLPLARFSDHHGPVLVSARIELGPDLLHEETLRLFVTPTARVPARFTGEFRDDVRAGSLLLEVGVDVDAAGFYRFDANVYDAAGAPVAFTTFKGELSRGHHFVPLEVFGKVLRDAGAHGPFAVDELRGYRFLEGAYPDRERLPDDAPRFVTRAWPATAFSDAVWTSPHKERMVELMMEDLARGIPLEVPPTPGPGGPPGGGPAGAPGADDATASPGPPAAPRPDAGLRRPAAPAPSAPADPLRTRGPVGARSVGASRE